MKSQTVLNKQSGFTLVEFVAVTVIVVVLAASAIPRVGAGEFAARTAADRLVAALQYAQVLAQRQGGASVVIAAIDPQITVKDKIGTVVPLANEAYSDYRVRLNSSISLSAGTVAYDAGGIPLTGATFNIVENGVVRYTVVLEPTGFAHLGS